MELSYEKLESAGFDVYSGEKIPVNDGGLSYGQIGFKLNNAFFTTRSLKFKERMEQDKQCV